ncbi:hypothetical protein HRbin34_00178 [bacterium HR34]|nr:hypothetical protein HRbin34_00178 [bacterium HR34]
MLGINPIGYGFKLASIGNEILSVIPEEKREEKIKLYQKEMKEFTQFLK